MTIQVTGVLVDPSNVAIDTATIRITALETSSVLACVDAKKVTDINGIYDFNLVEGKHKIEIKQVNKYYQLAYVEVTGATTSPITLENLIDQYAFCEVEPPTCPDTV